MADPPKPTDLLLDVTSFFAILLPGAVLVIIGPVALVGLVSVPISIVDPAAHWAVFLVASYVAGQVTYALASWFLDPIGDITYRRWRAGQRTALTNEVTTRLKGVYGRHADETGLFPLARAYLLSTNPAAWLTVERIEADAKFFRSMTMAALLVAAMIAVSSLQWGSEFVFGASALAAAATVLLAIVPGDMFKRRMQLVLLFVALFLLVVAIRVIWDLSWLAAFVFGSLALVLFLRFAQQKWQRNETLNELVLVELDARSRAPSPLAGQTTSDKPPES